jgi:signal transduction histidine kinase
MRSKTRRFLSGDNRFRLVLTLGLAVLLPAAALILVNFYHLKSIQRDKVLEGAIYGDFHHMLAISEKRINQKIYKMTEESRNVFPSPDDIDSEKKKKLEVILSKSPWLSHVFLLDEKGFAFLSQPERMDDSNFRDEHHHLNKMFSGWFSMEGKMLVEEIRKKTRPIMSYTSQVKRPEGKAYMTSAFFTLPQVPKDRVVLGGVSFEPNYLKKTFFPEILEELIASKYSDSGGNKLAMAIYPLNSEGMYQEKLLAASAGWKEGKPEVSRNFEGVFRGLGMGIKYQGTSVQALGESWVRHSFLILGVLSLLMIGGLLLTYRNVSKEMGLARLKSDFVSNVSHELRTPLALIRLYAETLELGRITTQEKKEEYYRIIRKESERLTALINNILDFSRIEAGRKEYDFRETDVAELVCNTLDAYRYQIEQQGFAFEQNIDSNIPKVPVDREAIARALVNLVNNALKYSANEKFLGVRLYRRDGVLKLEVVDRGIGITRREQSKIFEKFYRTGDPLVHNTRGSGLGLSLVRHITHAHGGEVEVESTPGKGSKFTLSFPLVTATQ